MHDRRGLSVSFGTGAMVNHRPQVVLGFVAHPSGVAGLEYHLFGEAATRGLAGRLLTG